MKMTRENRTLLLRDIGSSQRAVTLNFTASRIKVRAGCFYGTTNELRAAIAVTYDPKTDQGKYRVRSGGPKVLQKYAAEYLAVCDFADNINAIWYGKTGGKNGNTKHRRRVGKLVALVRARNWRK